jgi:hypothetical protein
MRDHEATFFTGRNENLLQIVRDFLWCAVDHLIVGRGVIRHLLIELFPRYLLLRVERARDVQETNGSGIRRDDLCVDFLDGETLG